MVKRSDLVSPGFSLSLVSERCIQAEAAQRFWSESNEFSSMGMGVPWSLVTIKSLVEDVTNFSKLDSFLIFISLVITSPGLTVMSKRGGMAESPMTDWAWMVLEPIITRLISPNAR